MTETASQETAFKACPYCGSIHTSRCPQVKAFEYHPDGSLKRVEFHDPVPPMRQFEPWKPPAEYPPYPFPQIT